MDRFELCENVGRQKALTAMSNIAFSNEEYYIKTTDRFCKWDFEIRLKGTNELIAIVEAKDRQMASTDRRIVFGGVQLEAQKYDTLVDIAQKRNVDAYYLATFTDGTYYIWNVVTSPVTEDERLCNKTTAEENGKVMKHCYYFAKKDCELSGKFEETIA